VVDSEVLLMICVTIYSAWNRHPAVVVDCILLQHLVIHHLLTCLEKLGLLKLLLLVRSLIITFIE